MKSKLITLFLLAALLFIPMSNAHAQSPNGDVVLVGDNYTLKSGESLNGSIVVIGGNVNVEKDAKVSGDVVVIGGNLTLDGSAAQNVVVIGGNVASSAKVSGDMVAIGGQISLKKTAVVTGNVVTFGGQLTREEGAEIGGEVVNNAPPVTAPKAPAAPNAPTAPSAPRIDVNTNPIWGMVGVFGRAIAIAAIAMLLVLFLQPQMERVSDAITQQPFLAGSFGLMSVVLAPLAILMMIVTIILIPVALITVMVLPLAWLFGMIALGQEVGERFTKAIHQIWAPVLSTGFGTFLLVLVVGFVGMVPCIGWLFSFLISLVAFGGVIMAWFGTRRAPSKSSAPVVVEIPPAS